MLLSVFNKILFYTFSVEIVFFNYILIYIYNPSPTRLLVSLIPLQTYHFRSQFHSWNSETNRGTKNCRWIYSFEERKEFREDEALAGTITLKAKLLPAYIYSLQSEIRNYLIIYILILQVYTTKRFWFISYHIKS